VSSRLDSVILGLLLLTAVSALPCTCVSAKGSNAKTAMADVTVVFRGTVIQRKILPQRVEMKRRDRYAVTFRVDEFWKGSVGRNVIVHVVDSGTDCLSDGGYEVGKNYLVYANRSGRQRRQFGRRVLVWLDRRAA
jgi:hypothetical protein